MHPWHGPQTNTRKHICLAWLYPKAAAGPTKVGTIITVIVVIEAPEHTTVTGGVVVVISDIMKELLQRKVATIMIIASG